jgi:hypothetical protein
MLAHAPFRIIMLRTCHATRHCSVWSESASRQTQRATSRVGQNIPGEYQGNCLELRGIDPRTSRMLSEHSTTELQPPSHAAPCTVFGYRLSHNPFSCRALHRSWTCFPCLARAVLGVPVDGATEYKVCSQWASICRLRHCDQIYYYRTLEVLSTRGTARRERRTAVQELRAASLLSHSPLQCREIAYFASVKYHIMRPC